MSSFAVEKLINLSSGSLHDKKSRSYRVSSVLLGVYMFIYGYRYYKYREIPNRNDYKVSGILWLGWLGGL